MVERARDIDGWLRDVSAAEDAALPTGVLSGDLDKGSSQIRRVRGPVSDGTDGLPLNELIPPTVWPITRLRARSNRGLK